MSAHNSWRYLSTAYLAMFLECRVVLVENNGQELFPYVGMVLDGNYDADLESDWSALVDIYKAGFCAAVLETSNFCNEEKILLVQ